jgi:hypothetical protein
MVSAYTTMEKADMTYLCGVSLGHMAKVDLPDVG